ncbi:MAG: DUF5805 domain-containing protein [Haloferacaceae archaeon]
MAQDTSRTTVKTYVPAYQKEEWQRHADRLDMSRSEFVRTMVQVGRRDFDVPSGGADGSRERTPESEPTGSDGLDERVIGALAETGPLSWEDLLAAVTADVEDRLEETLQRLQADNRVQYSGRDGGYRLVEDE